MDEERRLWAEYAAATREERWSYLVGKVLADAACARMNVARASCLVARPSRRDEMRLRMELPRALFAELAALCFERGEELMFLVQLGFLRIRGGRENVEIWSSDQTLEHVVIKTLLHTGRALAAMAQNGMFLACLETSRQGPVLRYTPQLTVADFRVMLRLQGLLAEYRLIHLRQPLGDGLLHLYNVGPGACILLQEIRAQHI